MQTKLKQLVPLVVAATMGLAGRSSGQDLSSTNQMDSASDNRLYRTYELDADLFGSAALGQHTFEHWSGTSVKHNIVGGGGGGLTGYFCRYVGVGADFNADARTHEFADSASGNIYLRLPIYETGLAPYAFGGGGYQFEDLRQSFGQGGAGLEFRFCRHMGIFADGRWVVAERSNNYALARVGVRFSF